jgi:hypothetical protein
MILNAPDPHAAEGGIIGLGKYKRVFDGDPCLIVVTVQDPLLQLNLGELPRVHENVIAMMVVVALRAFAFQPVGELPD